MKTTTTILATSTALAILVAVAGCERGPATVGAPAHDSASDKSPCPAVAVTYADPATIDEPWSGGIKDFCVLGTGGQFHVFHITDPATSWTTRNGEMLFGHASSEDLVTWNTHERIDLRTNPDGWSPSFTWAPHVIEHDNVFYMFYTGVKWNEGTYLSRAEQRVGLAVSSDLVTWKRYDENNENGLILDGPLNADHPWSAYAIEGLDLPWGHDCRDPFVFDRGPEHHYARFVMLNSVRLAPDAALMAIAFAVSDNLIDWEWIYYIPITVGEKAESANLIEHDGVFYLFWTDRDALPAVRVACSTGGIFGGYETVNGGERLFGFGNETLVATERTLYAAFDDSYVLHFKRELLLPEEQVPGPESLVRVTEFTECDGENYIRDLEH